MGCGASTESPKEEPKATRRAQFEEPVKEIPPAPAPALPVEGVLCVTWSFCGKYIALGCENGTVYGFKSDSFYAVWHADAHAGPITCAAVTHSATLPKFILGGKDGILAIHESANGRQHSPCCKHTSTVNSVVVADDDSLVFSAGSDRAVIIWEESSKTKLRTLKGHKASVWSLCLRCDNEYLFSGSDDSNIICWDVETGEIHSVFEGSGGAVYSMVATPDGKSLISCAKDRSATVWSIEGRKKEQQMNLGQDTGSSLALSADGSALFVAGSALSIWDWRSSERKARSEGICGPSARVLSSLCVAPNNLQAIVSSAANTICLDVSDFTLPSILFHHKGTVASIAISSDGQLAASGSEDTKAVVWQRKSGQYVHRALHGHISRVWSVAFSNDGTRLFSASEDCTVRVWDVSTGKCESVLRGHTQCVWAVSSLPGPLLSAATGSDDTTIRVWRHSAEGWMCERVLTHCKGPVVCLHTAQCDGQTLIASGSFDHIVNVWNDADSEGIVFAGHTDVVWCVVVCPKLRVVVSGSEDHTIRIWSLESRAVLCRHDFSAAVSSMALMGDHVALFGSGDGSLWQCDLHTEKVEKFTGERVSKSVSHSDSICAIAEHEGCILTGSVDMSIIYWRATAESKASKVLRKSGTFREGKTEEVEL